MRVFLGKNPTKQQPLVDFIIVSQCWLIWATVYWDISGHFQKCPSFDREHVWSKSENCHDWQEIEIYLKKNLLGITYKAAFLHKPVTWESVVMSDVWGVVRVSSLLLISAIFCRLFFLPILFPYFAQDKTGHIHW